MARDFNGSTDKILSTTAPITGYPFTLVCRFYPDAATNQFLVSLADVSETGVYQALIIDGGLGDQRLLASSRVDPETKFASSSIAVTTGSWHTAVGVFASASSRTVYLDGGNSGSNTDSVSFGAGIDTVTLGVLQRPVPGAFYNGRLADVGVYNVAWTADDVAAYQDGFSASLIRPKALVFHAPLVRNLVETRRAATLTATGTTVADHPRIILPRRRTIISVPAAVGGTTVTATGVSGTGSIGTVTATGGALVAPTGVSATGQIGTVTVAIPATLPRGGLALLGAGA